MSRSRWWNAVIFSATALLVASGCAGAPPGGAAPSARPGSFTICRELDLTYLPPGLSLKDRQLPNLGNGRLGRIVEYGAGERLLAFHVGVDPLEPLEDLDFETRSLVSSQRTYRVSETPLDRELLVAAWEESSVPEPCGELAILSRGLGLKELRRVADGTSLHRPS